MIKNQDRSGWFGASDTKYIMNDNHDTKTWKTWWSQKLGSGAGTFDTIYTRTGTLFEHPILDAIDPDIEKDGQIIIREKKIRVNYDGYKDGVIYEVKTHSAEKGFEIKKEYWMQCQVEMYVYMEKADEWFLPEFKKLYIVNYPLYTEDYQVTTPYIDPNRIGQQEIEYDEKFIKEYLRKLRRLARALEKGKFPG